MCPKAIHIMRPVSTTSSESSRNNEKKKPILNLYDPKQHPLQLYKNTVFQPPQRHHIALSEKVLRSHDPMEDISPPSSSSSGSDSSIHLEEEDHYSSSSEEEDSSSEEDIIDDARINRKLADLEISNQSLLIINEMLESTVHHQAKQVASFKKHIMTLPSDHLQEEEAHQLLQQENDWEGDEQFNRVKKMIELLIEEAQKALTHQVETGARVISGHHHRRTSSHRRIHRHKNETT